MGCIHSFFEQAVVMRKKMSKSQKNILVEDIDYVEIDNKAYEHLYLFYTYYCPSKLTNPFFLYILLNTYQYQLFLLWNQLENKYGSLQPCLINRLPYLNHMEKRITNLYKKYNKKKLEDKYFVSNLLNQYTDQEHLLIGKILQIYSGTEDLYSIMPTPPQIPPRPLTAYNTMTKYTKPEEPKTKRPEKEKEEEKIQMVIQEAVLIAKQAAIAAKQFSLDALIAPEMYCIDELRNHIPEHDSESTRINENSDDWDYILEESQADEIV